MVLEIFLDGDDIRITLKNGRKVVDSYGWTGELTLNEQLLPQIEALLKKNRVLKTEVAKVTTKVSKNSRITSQRIVKTLANAWNAGRSLLAS